MRSAYLPLLILLLSSNSSPAAEAAHKLGTTEQLPDGIAAPVADLVNPAGYSVTGKSGTVCDVWFVKELPVKPDFKPTLNVKYPMAPGVLIGLLRVPEKSKFTDFRGTPIQSGVYTLRYGQQPQDGNHIGTSDVADFLLALPAAADKDPKPISFADKLNTESAKASGTTHPAIFSLLPVEEEAEKASLTHDDDRDLWILSVALEGSADNKKAPLSLRLVTIGQSEG